MTNFKISLEDQQLVETGHIELEESKFKPNPLRTVIRKPRSITPKPVVMSNQDIHIGIIEIEPPKDNIPHPEFPINRTERRLYLTERLVHWCEDEDNHMAYIFNEDHEYRNVYALYQSLLNIIKHELLPISVWWGGLGVNRDKIKQQGLPYYLVIFRNGVSDPLKYIIRNRPTKSTGWRCKCLWCLKGVKPTVGSVDVGVSTQSNSSDVHSVESKIHASNEIVWTETTFEEIMKKVNSKKETVDEFWSGIDSIK